VPPLPPAPPVEAADGSAAPTKPCAPPPPPPLPSSTLPVPFPPAPPGVVAPKPPGTPAPPLPPVPPLPPLAPAPPPPPPKRKWLPSSVPLPPAPVALSAPPAALVPPPLPPSASAGAASPASANTAHAAMRPDFSAQRRGEKARAAGRRSPSRSTKMVLLPPTAKAPPPVRLLGLLVRTVQCEMRTVDGGPRPRLPRPRFCFSAIAPSRARNPCIGSVYGSSSDPAITPTAAGSGPATILSKCALNATINNGGHSQMGMPVVPKCK
jgi:hypothetical protein